MFDTSGLNEEQREAVLSQERALLLLAGPGSGKTYTITKRLSFLIEELQVPPDRILVVTFTKDAAISMQNRFLQTSSKNYPVVFGTFHSIFYSLLRSSRQISINKLLSEADKRRLCILLLKETIVELQNAGNDFLGNIAGLFLAAFSYYKNTEDKDKAKRMLPEKYQFFYEILFEKYHRRCEELGYIDFDDMVYLCKKLLKKVPSIRSMWQNQFSYILIDEFQDINPIQYEVVKLLAGENTSLFAVGDDDQSIYGFRGSDIHCLWSFQKDFDAKTLYLSTNYRSKQEIVTASTKVIMANSNRFSKQLKAYQKEADESSMMNSFGEKVVSLLAFKDADMEYKDILQRIKKALVSSKESIAVLFRTNLGMQRFSSYLTKENIPFEMKEKVTSVYEHMVSKDLLAYLSIIRGTDDLNLYERILNKPLRYLNQEALFGQYNPIQNLMEYYIKNPNLPYNMERIKAVRELDKNIRYIKQKSLFLQLQYVLNKMGYREYLNRIAGANTIKRDEYIRICDYILADATLYDNLDDYIDFIKTYNQQIENQKEDSKLKREDIQIHLMTAHGSKGLEFDTVILPDCNEGNYPYGKLLIDEEVEEERRIFYVAMTRAKKHLLMTYLTGNDRKSELPSRFLNPLLDKNRASNLWSDTL